MKLKMLISFVLVLVFMVSICCVSAFAAIDYTETYYMNGDAIRGYSLMTTNIASVATYSANIGNGKKLTFIYKYTTSAGRTATVELPVNSYVVNGLDTFDASYTASSGQTLTGVMGQHWVKASSYYIWSSHDCEDDSHIGNCVPDYSDL